MACLRIVRHPRACGLLGPRGGAAAAASRSGRSSRSGARRRRRGRCRRGSTRRTAGSPGSAGRSAASASRRTPAAGPCSSRRKIRVSRRGQLVGDLLDRDEAARAGRALDLEVVAVVVMELLQRLDDQEVDREPDRPAPVRVAAEQPDVGLARLVVRRVSVCAVARRTRTGARWWTCESARTP